MGKLVGFLLLLVVLGGVALGGGWFWLNGAFTAAGPVTADGKPRPVVIERGAATPAIAATLKEAGAIADADQFRLALRMREVMGDKPVMKAGEYEIASGASMEAIVKELSTGSPLQYAVIVPEGLSVVQIMDLLSAREWKATGGSDRAYKLSGEAPKEIAEGSLLPGDYAVSRGDTIASVVERMKNAQKALLDELWLTRAPDIPVKTKEDAIILASVVEKETGNADEQPTVAGLYSNRLRTGMRLQADATIVYSVTRGRPIGREIMRSEITAVNDWNTYSMDGLPKTPICNPGKGAIAAALNPANTKAIFMMADGKGGHHFSESLAEHEKYKSAYKKLTEANKAAGVNTPAVKPQR